MIKTPILKKSNNERSAKYFIDSLKVSILPRKHSLKMERLKLKSVDLSPLNSQKNTAKLIKCKHIRTEPNEETVRNLLFVDPKPKLPRIRGFERFPQTSKK